MVIRGNIRRGTKSRHGCSTSPSETMRGTTYSSIFLSRQRRVCSSGDLRVRARPNRRCQVWMLVCSEKVRSFCCDLDWPFLSSKDHCSLISYFTSIAPLILEAFYDGVCLRSRIRLMAWSHRCWSISIPTNLRRSLTAAIITSPVPMNGSRIVSACGVK